MLKFYLCLMLNFGFISPVVSALKECGPLPNQKTALVCGAGGFIGYHLVKRYKEEGFWVRGVDIKYPDFGESLADEFRCV